MGDDRLSFHCRLEQEPVRCEKIHVRRNMHFACERTALYTVPPRNKAYCSIHVPGNCKNVFDIYTGTRVPELLIGLKWECTSNSFHSIYRVRSNIAPFRYSIPQDRKKLDETTMKALADPGGMALPHGGPRGWPDHIEYYENQIDLGLRRIRSGLAKIEILLDDCRTAARFLLRHSSGLRKRWGDDVEGYVMHRCGITKWPVTVEEFIAGEMTRPPATDEQEEDLPF